MSNRIDLTKFEGLTTPWDFHAKYLHIESAKMAVKLIAELKRCYEELDEAKAYEETAEHLSNMIDSMWEKLDNWDMCFDDYSMHDLHNNLDEKYARDNEGNIILKELYSYTEEDGWQRKEPASE